MGLPLSRRIVFSQPLITEKSVAEIQKFDDPPVQITTTAPHQCDVPEVPIANQEQNQTGKKGTGFGFRVTLIKPRGILASPHFAQSVLISSWEREAEIASVASPSYQT
jgi:hypothetical protein